MSKVIIETFYEAFQSHDADKMGALYHEKATFSDPVFQSLDTQQVRAMWKMLIERSKGDLKIDYHSAIADQKEGACIWEATYRFSKTKNLVHNIIHATMKFQDGKIYEHRDQFSLWRWSSMALGTPGKLLGWGPFFKQKIKGMAMKSLQEYMAKH